MLSLFVYQETNCQCIRLDGPIQLDQISIFQRQEHWIVQAGSFTRRLGLSQPVSIEGRIFILQKETWSMVFFTGRFYWTESSGAILLEFYAFIQCACQVDTRCKGMVFRGLSK